MNTHKPFVKCVGCVVLLMLLNSCSKPSPVPLIPESPQPQNQQLQPQPCVPEPITGQPQPQSGEIQPQLPPGSNTAPGGSQPLPQPTSTIASGSINTEPTSTLASKAIIPGAPELPTATSEWLVLDYIDLAIVDINLSYDFYWNEWVLECEINSYSSAPVKNDGKIVCTGSITSVTGKNTSFVKEVEINKKSLGVGSIVRSEIKLVEYDEDALMSSYIECTFTQSEDMNSQNNYLKCSTTFCDKNGSCDCN